MKVMSYLLLLDLAEATGLTFHQITLELTGKRSLLERMVEHFHPPNPSEH